MKNDPVLVRQIWQVDNYTFSIEWSDGAVMQYRLSDLQKKCPCAACVDESSGKRLMGEKFVKEDVRAVRIVSLGRYALRIQFTDGCSNGIYGFDLLRNNANV